MEKNFNFTTAFAMKCNAEQFESVEKELVAIGHNVDRYSVRTYLCTNYNNENKRVGMSYCTSNQPLIIETFNRELYLALAAMTDKPDGIVGEWFKGSNGAFIQKKDDCDIASIATKATADELIKYFTESVVISASATNYQTFGNDAKASNYTPIESKPFVLPEKWYCPYENREQFEVMKNYFSKTWIYCEPNGVNGCCNDTSNNNWCYELVAEGKTKITFDQFMKYVVNQPETDPQIEALQKRIEDLEYNVKLLTTNMDKVIHQPEPKRYDIKTLSDIIDCTNESNLDNFLIDFKNLLILAHKAKAKGKKLNNAEFTWIDDGKNDILSYDIF